MSMTPDALMIPPGIARGPHLKDRMNAVLDVAEPLLGVDRPSGEKAYIRRQPGDTLFVTKDPYDTINHPVGSEGAGRPRYRWEPRDDGIKLGYIQHGD
jgi:hypothetical protein